MIRILAQDTSLWTRRRMGGRLHAGRMRLLAETAKRSDLAGWAEYGYCASHSRYFWGLRLHLVCTLARAADLVRTDRREGRRTRNPARHARHRTRGRATHPGQTIIGDKNYYGREFETTSPNAHPAAAGPQGRTQRAGAHLFKPLRQVIESINQTFKGQLDLERHGGRAQGVAARVLTRVLALTAAIWHNDKPANRQAVTDRLRSLTATTTPWTHSSSLDLRG